MPHLQLDPYINASRAQMGEGAFAAAWAEGRAMTLDEVIDDELGTRIGQDATDGMNRLNRDP